VKLASACASALISLPLALAAQTPVTSAEILQRVSAAVAPEVEFREVRTTRLLKSPLVSSGQLRYAATGRLERNTQQPFMETVVIDGMQVTIDRAGTTTELSLIAGTPLAAMVQTLRAVLGGQVDELDVLYRTTARGSLDRWTLSLEPRTSDGSVQAIRLSGSAGFVGEIEVLERNGDKTVTTLVR
jgi:outer membrane lipoprotein-sorting protein